MVIEFGTVTRRILGCERKSQQGLKCCQEKPCDGQASTDEIRLTLTKSIFSESLRFFKNFHNFNKTEDGEMKYITQYTDQLRVRRGGGGSWFGSMI